MRIAVLSDVHSNYIALEMVVAHARQRGVDDFWFLGDAVGYGWQPVETLSLLRELISEQNWVMGNHDALLEKRLHPGGFRPEAQIMINHNRLFFESEMKRTLSMSKFIETRFSEAAQPPRQKYIDGIVYFLTHSGLAWQDYNYYCFDTNSTEDKNKQNELFERLAVEDVTLRSWQFWRNLEREPRIMFLGHTHLPVVAYWDSEGNGIVPHKIRRGIVDLQKDCKNSATVVINPGSVGFPKDRKPYPSYVILDTKKRQVEFCRAMEYDWRKFSKGYDAVKRNVENYIRDGLWKYNGANHHNGDSFVNYHVGTTIAEDIILRIQQEVRDAPHPRHEYLHPDFKKFYESDSWVDSIQ